VGDSTFGSTHASDDPSLVITFLGDFVFNEDRWNELLPRFLAVWVRREKYSFFLCSAASFAISALEVAELLLRSAATGMCCFVLEGGWKPG